MSWFSHTLQSSGHQPPSPGMAASAMMEDLSYACLALPAAACHSPPTSLYQFPSVPRATEPPSLEDLSYSSGGNGFVSRTEPMSYATMQEQRCVLSWFQGWGVAQKERFLQDLLSKAVPGKVCTLLEQLNTLQVQDRPPNIFECQLRLWSQWFESWSEEERNAFLQTLEERDSMFVGKFYNAIAGTAGRK